MIEKTRSTAPWWRSNRPQLRRMADKGLPGCPAWPREIGAPLEWCRKARGKMTGCNTCPHRDK